MTVITYRKDPVGRNKFQHTVAVDGTAAVGSLVSFETIKYVLAQGNQILICGTGRRTVLAAMIDWYLAGADKTKFPAVTSDTDSHIIIFDKDNPPRQYHTIHPTPVESLQCTGGYMAWGGGYELAIGAMAAGASAAKAVDVAALHHWGCGAGCTEFEYDPKSHQWKIISETVYPRHKIRER
jgi:hypothetical protein